jgi:hypothetical protein
VANVLNGITLHFSYISLAVFILSVLVETIIQIALENQIVCVNENERCITAFAII